MHSHLFITWVGVIADFVWEGGTNQLFQLGWIYVRWPAVFIGAANSVENLRKMTPKCHLIVKHISLQHSTFLFKMIKPNQLTLYQPVCQFTPGAVGLQSPSIFQEWCQPQGHATSTITMGISHIKHICNNIACNMLPTIRRKKRSLDG